MRRRAETLVPIVVLLGFAVAAIVVTALLDSAERRGITALEESVTAEVAAIAGSQDQRFANTFAATQGISGGGAMPYEVEVGSTADLVQLEQIARLLGPDVRSGFYLVTLDGVVTQGVRFLGDPLGDRMEWPGFDELVASPEFALGGGVLPVDVGLTTSEPAIALVIPVGEVSAGGVFEPSGAFVFESVVAADSDLNREIGALQRGETGNYFFYDTNGTVIAANDSARIGQRLDDPRFLTEPEGLQRFDDLVVVLADVPAAGWRVGFQQEREEFEQALSGPLQTTGQILVLALLAAGLVMTVVLLLRLRAARAEQDRLRALAEAQQEFISIVSHELRTPVAGVLGFLETCLDHWEAMTDDERHQAISRAASNARRLQAMTRDVLDSDSVEAGRLVHVLARLDLGAEARIAVEAALDADPDRRIDLEVPDEPVWVRGDADRLQQVLANLLDNAVKNAPAMEPIEVAVRTGAAGAEVSVADRGPGIARDSLERIFDKFVRGRSDTVTGTGLGLYISRQIIDAHGGRIWAENDPEHGATFRFELPLDEGADEVVKT